MPKRKSKLYEETLAPFLLTKIKNWRGREFCSVQVSIEKPVQYLLSSDRAGAWVGQKDYETIRDAIQKCVDEKKAIKVNYIKRGGKLFINSLA